MVPCQQISEPERQAEYPERFEVIAHDPIEHARRGRLRRVVGGSTQADAGSDGERRAVGGPRECTPDSRNHVVAPVPPRRLCVRGAPRSMQILLHPAVGTGLTGGVAAGAQRGRRRVLAAYQERRSPIRIEQRRQRMPCCLHRPVVPQTFPAVRRPTPHR